MLSKTFRYAIVAVSLLIMTGTFVSFAAPPGESRSKETGDTSTPEPLASRQGATPIPLHKTFRTERQRFENVSFDAPILNALKASDVALSDSFTVVFELRVPASTFNADQGTLVKECTLTYLDGVIGLSMVTTQADDLIYSLPGPENGLKTMDYDKDRNLLVWRSNSKNCLNAPDLNLSIDEQELFVVSPSGEVTSNHVHNQAYKYAIGSEENAYEFGQFRLATGHGYSQHLKSLIEEPTAIENELLQVNARGVFGEGGYVGAWYLTVDSSEGNIVQEAFFHADAAVDRPALRVESYGAPIDAGAIPISSAGVIEYVRGPDRSHTVEFVVIDYSDTADEQHLADLRELLTNEIPIGTEIIDYSVSIPQRYEFDGTNLN